MWLLTFAVIQGGWGWSRKIVPWEMTFVRVFFKVLLKDSTFTDWTFKEAGDGN